MQERVLHSKCMLAVKMEKKIKSWIMVLQEALPNQLQVVAQARP